MIFARLLKRVMTKKLCYVDKAITTRVSCNGLCDTCILRFRCYTTDNIDIYVTKEEWEACKEEYDEDDI